MNDARDVVVDNSGLQVVDVQNVSVYVRTWGVGDMICAIEQYPAVMSPAAIPCCYVPGRYTLLLCPRPLYPAVMSPLCACACHCACVRVCCQHQVTPTHPYLQRVWPRSVW